MRRKSGDGSAVHSAAGGVQDYPQRSVALKFGWAPCDVDAVIQLDLSRAAAGKVTHASGTASLKGHIRKNLRPWLKSYEPFAAVNDADVKSNGAADLSLLAVLFTRVLRQHPDIIVSQNGDLLGVEDSRKAARQLPRLRNAERSYATGAPAQRARRALVDDTPATRSLLRSRRTPLKLRRRKTIAWLDRRVDRK